MESPPKRRRVDISRTLQALGLVLDYLEEHPPWTTSNLALTCKALRSRIPEKLRTNRYDVNRENLEWFEQTLKCSRYVLAEFIAYNGDLDWLKEIFKFDQVTDDTYEALVDTAFATDNIELLKWSHNVKFLTSHEVADRAAAYGALKILSLYDYPTLLQQLAFNNVHSKTYAWAEQHHPELLPVMKEKLEVIDHRKEFGCVRYFHKRGFSLDYETLYGFWINTNNLEAIEWLWTVLPKEVNLEKATYTALNGSLNYAFGWIELEIFQLLHRHYNLDLNRVQATLPLQRGLCVRDEKIVIWLFQQTGKILEATYFPLLRSGKVDRKLLEAKREFAFGFAHAEIFCDLKDMDLVKHLFASGFPKLSNLFDTAVENGNLKLARLLVTLPEYRAHWPTKIQADNVKLCVWLDTLLLPISQKQARAFAKACIRSHARRSFQWCISKLTRGNYPKLFKKIEKYKRSKLAIDLYSIYPVMPLWFADEIKYPDVEEAEFILNHRATFDCEQKSFRWPDNYEFYKKWKPLCTTFRYVKGIAWFRENWSEENFQLYLADIKYNKAQDYLF